MNTTALTGAPLGYSSEESKVELEFVFALDPAIKTKKGKVILIDADGNKHQEELDFRKVFQ